MPRITRRVGRLTARVSEAAWVRLPFSVRSARPVRAAGRLVHRRVCRRQLRTPWAPYTRFFRNPPQLAVVADIVREWSQTDSLRLASIACSTGAELYSAIHVARRARPDLRIVGTGVDLSPAAVAQARSGTFAKDAKELSGLTPDQIAQILKDAGDRLRVRESLRRDIRWLLGDAQKPELVELIGRQDIVLANNLLVHMDPTHAAACFRNIARVVSPGGYLLVWGVDPDVRTAVVRELELQAVTSHLRQIHAADARARDVWPWRYWGLEPLDLRRSDWRIRYATIFRVPRSHSGREEKREVITERLRFDLKVASRVGSV